MRMANRERIPAGYNADLVHYAKVVTALSETVRVMAEIDAAIPNWPIE